MFAWSLVLAATACFNPTFQEGIECNELGQCPEDMVCDSVSNTCFFTLPGACSRFEAPCEPNSTCVNGTEGTDEYTCVCNDGYQDNGAGCELILHGVVGEGNDASPRYWANDSYAVSCDAYLHPELPYVYEGSTGDGVYVIQPGNEPRNAYCDMTTDGGGFTRMVFWNRAADPATHTLASLQAQLIDEIAELDDPTITTMTDLIEGEKDIQWADVNATFDALAYRRDIDVPNRGDLLLDVHYLGSSMEQSATWLYATTTVAQDLLCRFDADRATSYSAAELALIPYACAQRIADNQSFTWDNQQVYALDMPITSFHLRSLHGDANADRSYLYRLNVWIR